MGNVTVQHDQQGIALMAALFMVLAVSLMGMTALHLAAQEIDSVTALRNEAAGRHLAEAGADLVVGWMHAPSTIPSPELGEALKKRAGTMKTGASFFDSEGHSQFKGTPDRPDVMVDARRPEDDAVLNDREHGWFRSLEKVGRVTEFKIFAPTQRDLLCTVELAAAGSTRASDAPQRVRVQLAALPIPPIRSAVRTGSIDSMGTTVSSVLAHWGDIQVVENATVEGWKDVPSRRDAAAVNGQSYYEVTAREDRWYQLRVGGVVTVLQPDSQYPSRPQNVLDRQLPIPGLDVDTWDYATLKRLAKTHGTYYVVDGEGRLHREMVSSNERGETLDDIMSSFIGGHRGLVFIDTLDQQPPRHDNLATLSLETPYAEGIFVVNAHVTWHPRGPGASLPVLSPPTGNTEALGARLPVQLTNVHLNGVLYVSGNLKVEESARMYGAVLSDGSLTTTGLGLEVWFNHDFQNGSFRGLPLVYVAPGSWRTV